MMSGRCWVGNAVSSVVSVWSKSDGLENDDRLPLRNALVDLVRVNGHVAHSEGWPPCVMRKLRDADEGAHRCIRSHLHAGH